MKRDARTPLGETKNVHGTDRPKKKVGLVLERQHRRRMRIIGEIQQCAKPQEPGKSQAACNATTNHTVHRSTGRMTPSMSRIDPIRTQDNHQESK